MQSLAPQLTLHPFQGKLWLHNESYNIYNDESSRETRKDKVWQTNL